MRIGVDVVQIARLQRILAERPTLARQVFSLAELGLTNGMTEGRRAEFLSGRFAAKEAVFKALGIGLAGGMAMTHVETLREETGAPRLSLTGSAAAKAAALGLSQLQVSISHDAGIATAFVLLM